LSEQPLSEFFSVLTDFAASHFVVYKTFAKILASEPKSTFTFISGGLKVLIYLNCTFRKNQKLLKIIR